MPEITTESSMYLVLGLLSSLAAKGLGSCAAFVTFMQ